MITFKNSPMLAYLIVNAMTFQKEACCYYWTIPVTNLNGMDSVKQGRISSLLRDSSERN